MSENQNLQGAAVIAKIFGVSTRRIEQLKGEGIIKGSGKPTKYDLLPTIQAYIKFLSDKAYGREKKEAIEELEKQRLESEVTINASMNITDVGKAALSFQDWVVSVRPVTSLIVFL